MKKYKPLHILFYTQYFFPEIGAAPNRSIAHTRFWAQKKHQVTVVTSFPNSPKGIFYPGYKNKIFQKESWNGIDIVRVWTLPAGKKDTTVKRILCFLVYSISALLSIFHVKSPDVVIASAPYLSGVPGLIAALIHRVPLVYEMRDPWVQVNLANKKLNRIRFIYQILHGLEKFIIKQSACVVVIGKAMAQSIKQIYKLRALPQVIYNGTSYERVVNRNDNGVARLRRQNKELNGKFVVGFIGNINNAWDLNVVIDAAMNLKSTNCVFLFVGEGAQKEAMRKKAEILGLKNIIFYPAVEYDKAFEWFALCDITVAPLKKDDIYKVYLPVKIFDSMGAGRSVLFGGDGEAKEIVESSKGGSVFEPGNSSQLTEMVKQRKDDRSILEKEGEVGQQYVISHFTRKVMAERYIKIVENVVRKETRKKF